MDFGISEKDFWEMTFAEIFRVMDSKRRVIKQDMQRRASFDYILADLIGYSTARVHNSRNKMPTIQEVYPNLFEVDEEEVQKKKDELSVLRFKLFAQAFNKNFNEKGAEIIE